MSVDEKPHEMVAAVSVERAMDRLGFVKVESNSNGDVWLFVGPKGSELEVKVNRQPDHSVSILRENVKKLVAEANGIVESNFLSFKM